MGTYDEDIDATVRSVWSAMLALPLEPVQPFVSDIELTMTAVVVLDGDFGGAVKVGCGSGLASRIAAAMFAAVTEPTPDDVRDALGEVANMIAGNLKTALPGQTHMGLPIVAVGTDYELSIPRAEVVGLVHYRSADGGLRVSLEQEGRSPQ